MSRNDPIQNFRFRVEIDGITQASFNKVVMPQAKVDTIEYREGTDPTFVRKLSGLTSYSNVILKWGITDGIDLYNWIKSIIEQGASDNRRNMLITLIDEEGRDRSRWEFVEAWPVRYKISDLNAMSNEVVFEIIEITFESFNRVS